MSRKPRKNLKFSFNHVMVRGNNKQAIFADAEDYKNLSAIIEMILLKYKCEIHLFCFMTNHIHLLIQTDEIPLSRIMSVFLSRYSKYFSKRHNFIGHLFQGRYLAKHVNNDNYFLELLFYIHANPVKANIVKKIEDYYWSSHNSYSSKTNFTWLRTDYLHSLLKKNNYLNYSDFIFNKTSINLDPIFCNFDQDNLLNIEYEAHPTRSTAEDIDLTLLDFKTIARVVCEVMEINFKSLDGVSQKHEICLARSLIAYFAHFSGKYTLTYISIQFARHVNSVSDTMYRYLKNTEFQTRKNKCLIQYKKLIVEKTIA